MNETTTDQWLTDNWWWLLIITVWSIFWTAWGMWRAAKNDSKPWFILLLITNTLGILEMFYIFYFSKKDQKPTESEKLS